MGSIYGEKFWELVEDIKAVGPSLRDENRQRYQRMLENPNVYNVVNHALWGLLDGAQAFWKSAVARSHAMLEDPSAFNIINYLTLGLGDVVKTAFDPSARLSEMLSAQVGVVTVAFGAYTAAGGTSVFKPSTLGKELSRNPKTYGYTKDAAAWASNISVGENHNVDIGITVLNDLDMQERKTITFYFQQIDESFAYYICGIFDFDARMINAGSIKIELDEDEVSLTDYAYLDGKSVIIRADRISARFID